MEGFFVTLLVFFTGFSNSIDLEKHESSTAGIIHKQELVYWADNSCLKCHDSLMVQKYKHAPSQENCTKCHVSDGTEHPSANYKGFNFIQPVTNLCFSCHELNTKKNLHQPSKEGSCINCHNPHSSKNKSLLRQKKSADLCSECHKLNIKDEDIVHNPVSSGRCHKCHDPHQSDFNSFLKNEVPSLCYNCHDGIAEELNLKRIHAPAKEDCLKCHDPHNNKQGYLLPDSVPTLCYSCHNDIRSKKYIHAPAKDGKCKNCHEIHGSNNKSLLKNKKSAVMCNECHQLNIKENDFVHNPVSSGRCHKCHDAHQSDYASFLKEDKEDLCYKCHTEIKERIDSSAYTHKAISTKKACINCHSPHASPENMFLIKKEKELCLSCHNKTYSTKEGKVSNIKQLLKKSKTVHDPVSKGCSSCHNPHSSEVYALLKDEFPEGEYTFARKENFTLCFNCHNNGLIEMSVSDTITRFRNGQENLHFVHIKGRKGRNCNLCHNVHASVNEHLINTEASYGNWKMQMNYLTTENGGSCNNGCHSEKKYDRLNKVINDPNFDIANIKKYRDYVDKVISFNDKNKQKVAVTEKKIVQSKNDTIAVKTKDSVLYIGQTDRQKSLESEEENIETKDSVIAKNEFVALIDSAKVKTDSFRNDFVTKKDTKIIENTDIAETKKNRINKDSAGKKGNQLSETKIISNSDTSVQNKIIETQVKQTVNKTELETNQNNPKDNQTKTEIKHNDLAIIQKEENNKSKEQDDDPDDQKKKQEKGDNQTNKEDAIKEEKKESEKTTEQAKTELKKDDISVTQIEEDKSKETTELGQIQKDLEDRNEQVDTVDVVADITIRNENKQKLEQEIITTSDKITEKEVVKGEKVIVKQKEEVLTESNIEFVYAKTVIAKGMQQQFNTLADYLKAHPELEIEVHGHTDAFGSDKYNYILSRKRAEKLKSMLVEDGIDASRIHIKAHGSKRPVASNYTEEGRAKNRRVEIKTLIK